MLYSNTQHSIICIPAPIKLEDMSTNTESEAFERFHIPPIAFHSLIRHLDTRAKPGQTDQACAFMCVYLAEHESIAFTNINAVRYSVR